MKDLIVDWSQEMSQEELKYKNNGFMKTRASVFNVACPSNDELIKSFNLIENELSVGCIAL